MRWWQNKIESIPVKAYFQYKFDTETLGLMWIVYDRNGMQLGWSEDRLPGLQVVTEQERGTQGVWLVRLENGTFLDARPSGEKYSDIREV